MHEIKWNGLCREPRHLVPAALVCSDTAKADYQYDRYDRCNDDDGEHAVIVVAVVAVAVAV